jgi:hypothetical protein
MAQNSVISFKFGIHLHSDDIKTLEFIKDRLNCGVISSNHTSGSAKFELNSLDDIRTKLIPLLDNFPLNGVKYLDYLAFKEGINIKLNEGELKHKKHELILGLKNSMNSKRVDFEMPFAHKIAITPY